MKRLFCRGERISVGRIRSVRKILKNITGLALAIVISLIVVGLYADDLVEVTMQEDYSVSIEGSDIVFDGSVYIDNPFYWEMEDVTISLWVEDHSNGKEYKVWDSPEFDVPARDSITVPVHASFELTSFSAAVINSVSTEDSFVSFKARLNGDLLFGLLEVDADTHVGVQLAEDGEVLTYETVASSSESYTLKISNLKESLKIQDFDAVLISANSEVSVSSRNYVDFWIFEMSSSGNLDENIDYLCKEEVSAVGLPDGTDSSTVVQMLYLLTYARWFI